MAHPLLITFEGPEGAGKSTQCRILAERLVSAGLNVLVTRQPGGTPLGAQLRRLLLDTHESPVAPATELLLMMADRAQADEFQIRPHLDNGGVVLCDRYTDSSVAYQGFGRGLDIALIDRLNEFATQGTVPARTYLLDIDPTTGLNRQSDRTRMEREQLEFHLKVRDGYLRIARHQKGRFVIVDASRSVEEVAQVIWSDCKGVI